MKKIVVITFILLLSLFFGGCISGDGTVQVKKEEQNIEKSQQTYVSDERNEDEIDDYEKTNSIIYENIQYGFSFSLPESWKNYLIISDKWEGFAIEGEKSGKIIETGLIIYIRHPKWTSENQRQDIPIMIFTLTQWNSLQMGEFHIGAAPIRPSELGRNKKYVFALPARYNYAFPTGYEEVENILKSNSFNLK